MATPTSAFSVTLFVQMDNAPGVLGRLATDLGAAGGNITAVSGFEAHGPLANQELVVYCRDEAHARKIVDVARGCDGVRVVDAYDRTFRMHEGGKIEVISLAPVNDRDDLSMAYTPGVARVCMAIHDRPELSFEYTIRKNTVAVVSDGTAVLGLGDIGPAAAMPVMEGKALLFKTFAGVDAFPVCLDTKDPDEIIETVVRLAPSFGGVNLEDIAAPNCFYIEEELKKRLQIPIFHDDQHGTAVVTLAALVNSLKLVGKKMEDLYVVVAGVGAAGVACAKIMMSAGVKNIVGCDRQGAIFEGRDNLNFAKEWFAKNSNFERKSGTLSEVMDGADVFVGVSGPNLITASDIRRMAKDPIVFAMANPDPEIRPEHADGLPAVMATGRSDYPNQINNVLAFPGIFRGALDVGATDITESMKVAAAKAIAEAVDEEKLSPGFVVPSVFDRDVPYRVAQAVAEAAVAEGICRAPISLYQ
jgi:malate dehydrogenase (oxaloacetate-decarboxylating)